MAQAASAIQADVRAQLAAALHGPFAGALAAGAPPAHVEAPTAAEASLLLGAEIPRRFIAAGGALSVAYAALAEGDETRTAGALLCAERILFPDDPEGAARMAGAVRAALRHLDTEPAASATEAGERPQDVEAMQRSVAALAAALERAFAGAAGHLEAASLGARSWLAATGGAGPASGARHTQFGPFLDGLVRWAFFTEAALEGIRADDWARVGAALVAARWDVRRGGGDFYVPPVSGHDARAGYE